MRKGRASGSARPVDEQMRVLMRGVEYGDEQIHRTMERELRERLAEGQRLRVYLGVDPTAPDLTLGHTVAMRKLRQFQELGHEAVLLIGGFTSLIGDPSDKESVRPMLTAEEIEANAQTYLDQAFTVLDPELTVIRNNAEWLSKLSFADLIKIASNYTVGQFLQRESFAQRRRRGDPIYVHEFFYAFMQAYDAVALETDVQVGGIDQLFNLMAGRDLQRAYGQRPQIAVTTPILVGTDGTEKMSKTAGNHIALNDPPGEMYGKVMSIPDRIMMDYFTLVTDVPAEEIEEMRRQLAERSVNPMELKKRLAFEITKELHGEAAAQEAEEGFTRVFQEREVPQEVQEVAVSFSEVVSRFGSYNLETARRVANATNLGWFLSQVGLAASRSEGTRLVRQGAVEINGEVARSNRVVLEDGMIIRVGKHRFLRIVDADRRGE